MFYQSENMNTVKTFKKSITEPTTHTVDLGEDIKLDAAYMELRQLIDRFGYAAAREILKQQRENF